MSKNVFSNAKIVLEDAGFWICCSCGCSCAVCEIPMKIDLDLAQRQRLQNGGFRCLHVQVGFGAMAPPVLFSPWTDAKMRGTKAAANEGAITLRG